MQLPADMILSVSEVQKTRHEGSVPDLSVVFCCVMFFFCTWEEQNPLVVLLSLCCAETLMPLAT